VQVADGEDKVFPVGVVHLLQELLVDHRGEGLVETGFETLRGFVGDLDDFLQQAQGESIVRFAGDPQSEIFVWFLAVAAVEGDDHLFGLLHELEA
jgi:hypothetical protein